MSIDLEDMAADIATATVYWKKDSMDVRYRPSVITLERIEKFEKSGAVEGQEDIDEFLQFLTDMIESWDLRLKGNVVNVNQENLRKLPFPFLRAVLTTVLEDVQSGEAEKPSDNGSAPRATRDTAQAGIPSSERPSGSEESHLGSFSTTP